MRINEKDFKKLKSQLELGDPIKDLGFDEEDLARWLIAEREFLSKPRNIDMDRP